MGTTGLVNKWEEEWWAMLFWPSGKPLTCYLDVGRCIYICHCFDLHGRSVGCFWPHEEDSGSLITISSTLQKLLIYVRLMTKASSTSFLVEIHLHVLHITDSAPQKISLDGRGKNSLKLGHHILETCKDDLKCPTCEVSAVPFYFFLFLTVGVASCQQLLDHAWTRAGKAWKPKGLSCMPWTYDDGGSPFKLHNCNEGLYSDCSGLNAQEYTEWCSCSTCDCPHWSEFRTLSCSVGKKKFKLKRRRDF